MQDELLARLAEAEKTIASVFSTIRESLAACSHSPVIISDRLVIETRHNGKRELLSVDQNEQQSTFRRRKFDLIVDEVHNSLVIGRKQHELCFLPGMQQGMLWLVLTHAGSILTVDEIKRLFGMARDAEHYQYRVQLRKLLGNDLIEHVLPKGAKKKYAVGNFSFHWTRSSEDPDESILLDLVNDR